MRRFLYLSPYFPPQTRVGALRPLKLTRHLVGHGWSPLVLCDLSPGDAVDPHLAEAIPPDVTVIRDWSRRAGRTPVPVPLEGDRSEAIRPGAGSWRERLGEWASILAGRLAPHPETLPLGAHLFDLPHARGAARRALADHPECRAVVVNADPFAALLVGRTVATERGLPLVVDLRDPWAPCELRRPHRRGAQRAIVDRLERSVVEAAARVILNTDTARDDYRAHYPDVDPDRFVTIRNGGDPDLVAVGPPGAALSSSGPVRLLYLGSFRRHVEGDPLFRLLAELADRGCDVRLVVTGRLGPSVWQRARRLGVEDFIEVEGSVPYRRIGAAMAEAHILVALGHPGSQRIPAKIYDYLTSDRPILALTDNSELAAVLAGVDGAHAVGPDDPAGAADRVERIVRAGVGTRYPRSSAGLLAADGAATLARLLDDVTGGLAP